jgi:hypothetical protein
MFAMFDEEGIFRDNDFMRDPQDSPAERKAITMQLAIEAMTRRPEIRVRIEESPYYARLIYDTFYFLDTFLQEPAAIEEISPKKLDDYLWKLSPASAQAHELLGKRKLYEYLLNYIDLLANPAALKEEVLRWQLPLGGSGDAQSIAALSEYIDEKMPILRVGLNSEFSSDIFAFSFTADKYGFRAGTGFKWRDGTDALRKWRAVVGRLFGDDRLAWTRFVEAGLAPSVPDLSSIDALLYRVRFERDDRERLSSDDRRAQSEADIAATCAWMLRRLQEFAYPLTWGFLWALVASTAVIGGSFNERRFRGLRTVSRLFGQITSSTPDHGVQFFKSLSPPASPSLEEPYEQARKKIEDFFTSDSREEKVFSLGTGPIPDFNGSHRELDFETEPKGLVEWVNMLEDLGPMFERVEISLEEIASAYWSQWTVVDGVLERNRATSKLPTILDVLHAAAHGGVPMLSLTRETQSVAEFSRVRLLAKHGREAIPNSISNYAFKILVNGKNMLETESADSVAHSERGYWAAVLLSLFSADSEAWYWVPEANMSSSIVIPIDAQGETRITPGECEKLYEDIVLQASLLGTPVIRVAAREHQAPEVYDQIRIEFGASGFRLGSFAALLDRVRAENPGRFSSESRLDNLRLLGWLRRNFAWPRRS